ncbi:hypothetical protein [Geminicoccus harenae]|uniref:hypothetical protein n=1 Tax=Geminicoccus harenae TaxID=2498453 RepID=UPI00168B217C|nr:hypothetical protein [Geminicoccus harenae]
MTKPRSTLGISVTAVAPTDADLLHRVAAALAKNDDRAWALRQLIQKCRADPPAAWLAVLAPTKH